MFGQESFCFNKVLFSHIEEYEKIKPRKEASLSKPCLFEPYCYNDLISDDSDTHVRHPPQECDATIKIGLFKLLMAPPIWLDTSCGMFLKLLIYLNLF